MKGVGILVIGSINTDILVRVRRAARPGETVLGQDAQLSPGGKGANQAVAAARAGASVSFCGALGCDAFATMPRQALAAAGVDLGYLRELDAPSGLALITVSGEGENSITVASGANARFAPEHLPADFGGVTHLLMQQEIPPATVLAAAHRARHSGAQVLLNAAPAREISAELWPLLDMLIVNEHELAQLTGTPESQPQRSARSLLANGVGAVIVTLGARGSLAITAQGMLEQPAHKVKVIDTTGAGDTFCGVLAAWLSSGAAQAEALRAANVAGALACTRLGAQAAMPTEAEIEAAL